MMNTRKVQRQESNDRYAPTVNVDDFGEYLEYTSFQDIVHQVRKLSMERIIANELIPEYQPQPKTHHRVKTA
jgi:hypothetical protein